MSNTFSTLTCVLSLFLSCFASKKQPEASSVSFGTDGLPYNLREASHTIFFESNELKEISGLTTTDQPGVFCAVQDEQGVLYFVDATGGGELLWKVKFREKGDFEGVEIANGRIYALKSDGDIFEISNWKKDAGEPKVEKFDSPLTKDFDVEGLCHDPARNALLLACKGNPDSAKTREIFAFDLNTKKLSEKPIYTINPLEIDSLMATKPDDNARFVAPAGIAIQPKTNDVYVISSVKKRLMVLDYQTGKIKHALQLDKKILPQPEGICFDEKGNLYIGSEGKNGGGLLLRFDLKN